MIAICEPSFKHDVHESVNAGFIYGLSLAYPDEKILFFSDKLAWENIKRNASLQNADLSNIEHHSIYVHSYHTAISSYIWSSILITWLFNIFKKRKITKVLFLSHSPLQRYLIKYFASKPAFIHMRFALVLHGGFETFTGEPELRRDRSLSPPPPIY